ncbi:hypothetical protein CDAR_425641 [Caerostris darwini]|uniref:Uncharacterized protein n=1 Tax=Caerostris darwini TaxID=1538125 RepID=A0AAV4N0J0_9ARAC|nr:hypothetical protein CDAR_425641 [Caerostris darwini]
MYHASNGLSVHIPFPQIPFLPLEAFPSIMSARNSSQTIMIFSSVPPPPSPPHTSSSSNAQVRFLKSNARSGVYDQSCEKQVLEKS